MNFCERCCDSTVDSLKQLQKFECVRKCKATFKDDSESQVWMQCIESSKPNQSGYQYCETTFAKGAAQIRCKVDFCKMCCTNMDDLFNRRFDPKSVRDCDRMCIESYLDSEDYVV